MVTSGAMEPTFSAGGNPSRLSASPAAAASARSPSPPLTEVCCPLPGGLAPGSCADGLEVCLGGFELMVLLLSLGGALLLPGDITPVLAGTYNLFTASASNKGFNVLHIVSKLASLRWPVFHDVMFVKIQWGLPTSSDCPLCAAIRIAVSCTDDRRGLKEIVCPLQPAEG